MLCIRERDGRSDAGRPDSFGWVLRIWDKRVVCKGASVEIYSADLPVDDGVES